MKSLTASDRKSLIRLASSLPKGDKSRRAILAGLVKQSNSGKKAAGKLTIEGLSPKVQAAIDATYKKVKRLDLIVKKGDRVTHEKLGGGVVTKYEVDAFGRLEMVVKLDKPGPHGDRSVDAWDGMTSGSAWTYE